MVGYLSFFKTFRLLEYILYLTSKSQYIYIYHFLPCHKRLDNRFSHLKEIIKWHIFYKRSIIILWCRAVAKSYMYNSTKHTKAISNVNKHEKKNDFCFFFSGGGLKNQTNSFPWRSTVTQLDRFSLRKKRGGCVS